MVEFLYHYYDESTGPFRNLSDLGKKKRSECLTKYGYYRRVLRVNALRIILKFEAV